MGRYGLIGWPLGQSFSREVHGRLADYDYELIPLREEDFPAFMEAADFSALNVTIPYKQRVIPYLDWLSPRAREIGAVNTIIKKDGRLQGYNTDAVGLEALIRRAGFSLKGKEVLISGSGGTSLTAREVCRRMGASPLFRLSRREKAGTISYRQAYQEEKAAACLINTTPVGMFPHPGETAIDVSAFPGLEGVVDVVYNPLRTQLAMEAEERGVAAVTGLYMLVSQAYFSACLFLGESLPGERAEEIYRQLLREKRNIVLTGMPSSGKTTIGRFLQRMSGRRLVDTDEELVKRVGKSIPQLMAEEGVSAFRQQESQLIQELSQETGLIIATGGGAVLNQKNRDALKANGRLYYIQRPLEELKPTASRPLSADQDKLARLYQERKAVYEKADITLDCARANSREIAEYIWKHWKEDAL